MVYEGKLGLKAIVIGQRKPTLMVFTDSEIGVENVMGFDYKMLSLMWSRLRVGLGQ